MRHGEKAGYQAGCREQCCRIAARRDHKRRDLAIARGHQFQTDSAATRRRLEALQAMGHPKSAVAERLGITQQAMSRIYLRDTIRTTTATRIAEVYEAMCMTVPEDTPYSRRTKNEARAKRYLPPLAWEDIERGIKAEGEDADPSFIDEAVVERILSGDLNVRSTPAEKQEVTRRWLASGRSQASLCRITGWNEGRYAA